MFSLVYVNKVRALQSAIPMQDLEMVDDYGNTPLLMACFLGRDQCVEILVQSGASLKAMNYFGQNALTLATYSGNTRIALYLMRYRSYEDFTASSIIPPLCVAILRNNQKLTEIFCAESPTADKIRTVHGVGTRDMVKIFMANDSTSTNIRL
ncbi:DNA replication inhibitor plutonium isoform X2 [Hermetia illucens]|uniref:DNA replication inhibitor plutonium isoform X2 n=1 Tax=Hermetia illucens TaxID=343691 RepID=UPI0018CC7714|nr:DNA replication inhibitor plutonium isoform X2 [Hermetia illucens]